MSRKTAGTRADREKTVDEIYERIYVAILEHRLHPGTKLGEERMADIFGVPAHVLRFGGPHKNKVAETQAAWPAGTGARERHVIEAFLALPPKRRELVGELVKALSAG